MYSSLVKEYLLSKEHLTHTYGPISVQGQFNNCSPWNELCVNNGAHFWSVLTHQTLHGFDT